MTKRSPHVCWVPAQFELAEGYTWLIMTDETPTLFDGFKITCLKCASSNIELEDTRGYSPESGSWGEIIIKCVDCGYVACVTET